MASEWKESTIAEIAETVAMGPFGSDIKTDNFVESGVPVIRGGNLGYGRFKASDFVYLTEEKADSLNKANAYPGDIVFTHRGTLGQVGIIPKGYISRYVVSQSQMKLSVDRALAHPLFVYYFFKSPLGQHSLLAYTSQTGVPAISRPVTSLKSIRIPLPPLAEQKRIAQILGALDDKIELNRRMNATLEQMARALFKSWFVDFDPVRAKLDSKTPLNLDPATAALFPSEFQETSLGLIPKSWKVRPLSDGINILSGGTPKTSIPEYWDGSIPWYSVRDVPAESDVWVIETEKQVTQLGIDNSAAQVLQTGTTIISARGTVGKLALVGAPMAMNQSCYGIKGKGYSDLFTYFLLREAISDLQQRTHGTVFDTITRTTFKTLECAFPNKALTTAFDAEVKPLLDTIKTNLHQSNTLARLRDTLLPKLLRGELSTT